MKKIVLWICMLVFLTQAVYAMSICTATVTGTDAEFYDCTLTGTTCKCSYTGTASITTQTPGCGGSVDTNYKEVEIKCVSEPYLWSSTCEDGLGPQSISCSDVPPPTTTSPDAPEFSGYTGIVIALIVVLAIAFLLIKKKK